MNSLFVRLFVLIFTTCYRKWIIYQKNPQNFRILSTGKLKQATYSLNKSHYEILEYVVCIETDILVNTLPFLRFLDFVSIQFYGTSYFKNIPMRCKVAKEIILTE